MDHVQGFFTNVVAFEENLRGAGTVPQINETDGAFTPIGFHEADDRDFLTDEVGSGGLQFAQGVGSVGGWYPCGHGLWAPVENMKHSPSPVGVLVAV